MTACVRNVAVADRFHHNGDAFWDGDQTLYEVEVDDAGERGSLLFVVARGDAFISERIVKTRVEGLGLSLAELRSLGISPGPRRRPQIRLVIEPGDT